MSSAPINAIPISPASPLRSAAGARPWLWLLAVAVLLRLLSLPLMALTDHTEARYAEIARLMVQLGDWVSPHVTPGEVFWAKPPLSTWSQALLMELFGVNEWSGRLAAWGWALLGLWSLDWMLRASLASVQRAAALTALMLCPMYFICAGAVMTDATLMATVLLVQAAWWRAVTAPDAAAARRAGRVLAFGLGLALLTKGPAAGVLALLPPVLHALWRGHWAVVGRILKDPLAWLIWLGLTLPWYAWAEQRTPGFLQYFLLGEHVMRFLQPGWKGDRYGFAHAQPIGMIWLFVLVSALPWILHGLAAWLGGRRAGTPAPERLGRDLWAYALCITAAPLLLFSAARNIIPTYAVTALPGVVLLWLAQVDAQRLGAARHWGAGLIVLLLTALGFLWLGPKEALRASDRELIRAYEKACGAQAWTAACGLEYASKPDHSAFFYSAGRLYAQPEHAVVRYQVLDRDTQRPHGDALACNKHLCLYVAP
ncbi:glycosyltransferase family 39 protein [Mitsuaria sp. WAJ17]|uniref:ArnT family glycosyltransferase n=1 Tax=Mitsuaria sp. WAJ17 TaxID=2761452 RepID=UPI0015FF5255|nr:glycosyltransferase family 39 protein [Mitsuaria sp. WAJ17]MBB2485830.1 glycosyltransferase family 39 protein [Mitsuaria sp. WAJ17]